MHSETGNTVTVPQTLPTPPPRPPQAAAAQPPPHRPSRGAPAHCAPRYQFPVEVCGAQREEGVERFLHSLRHSVGSVILRRLPPQPHAGISLHRGAAARRRRSPLLSRDWRGRPSRPLPRGGKALRGGGVPGTCSGWRAAAGREAALCVGCSCPWGFAASAVVVLFLCLKPWAACLLLPLRLVMSRYCLVLKVFEQQN